MALKRSFGIRSLYEAHHSCLALWSTSRPKCSIIHIGHVSVSIWELNDQSLLKVEVPRSGERLAVRIFTIYRIRAWNVNRNFFKILIGQSFFANLLNDIWFIMAADLATRVDVNCLRRFLLNKSPSSRGLVLVAMSMHIALGEEHKHC